jgi:hypothetical protein
MTKHQFGTIGCRLLSLYFISTSLMSIGTPIAIFASSSYRSNSGLDSGLLITFFLPVIMPSIVGLLLWCYAPSIAWRMYPVDEPIA